MHEHLLLPLLILDSRFFVSFFLGWFVNTGSALLLGVM